jgi:hypothetical protein
MKTQIAIITVSVLLAACPSQPVVHPEDKIVAGGAGNTADFNVEMSKRITLAYQTYATIENVTADLLRQDYIDLQQAQQIRVIATSIRPLIDTAKKDLVDNKPQAANNKLHLANDMLLQLQNSLQGRVKK